MVMFTTAKALYQRIADSKTINNLATIPFQDARYLFYGEEIDVFSHFLTAYIMKHYSKGILIGLGDYHDGYLFDLNTVADYLAALGVDPMQAFDNLLVGSAYNLRQFEKLVELLKHHKDYPLLIMNIDRLVKDLKSASKLNNLVWKALTGRETLTILTASINEKSKTYPPKPNTTHFIRSAVDTVVFVKKINDSMFSLYLLKHPLLGYKKAVIGVDYYGSEHPLA